MRTLNLFTSAAFLACLGQQVHLPGETVANDGRLDDRAYFEKESNDFRNSIRDEFEDLVNVANEMLLTANTAAQFYEANECGTGVEVPEERMVLDDLLESMTQMVDDYVL